MKKVDLVVVGAGPAGIGVAVEAKIAGKEVVVLEKSEICQTLLTFYKDGKRVDKEYKGHESRNLGHIPFEDGTKESTLTTFKEALEQHKIAVECGSEVESVKKENGEFIVATAKESYACKSVVVAIGRMGKPNKPTNYKIPSSLNKVVNFNANSVQAGENIIIVGGGNSAAEYAVDLANTCKATLCYRQKAFTRLNDTNLSDIESANQAGKVQLKLGVDIEELSDENGKVAVKFNDGTSEIYDRAIYAIGGSTPVDFLQKCGINVDEQGIPIFDENKQSSVAGIFVAGDIATKNGASIIVGLNDGVKIAKNLS